MSFNYLLESDMYKRPFEMSRVQSAGQGPALFADSAMQGAQQMQGLIANDIQIGVGQMKAQEAQMRLQAMDQELMVASNKENYLMQRAQRKLMEAKTKQELQQLQQAQRGGGYGGREGESRMQRIITAMGEKRIPVPGQDGRAYVVGLKDGKFNLVPETDEQYSAYKKKSQRESWFKQLEILKKGRASGLDRDPNSFEEREIIRIEKLIGGKESSQGRGYGERPPSMVTGGGGPKEWKISPELAQRAMPGLEKAFEDQKVRETLGPYLNQYGDKAGAYLLYLAERIEKKGGWKGLSPMGATTFMQIAKKVREHRREFEEALEAFRVSK